LRGLIVVFRNLGRNIKDRNSFFTRDQNIVTYMGDMLQSAPTSACIARVDQKEGS
jgi:hypothetical protein